jgi:hypothetical protein
MSISSDELSKALVYYLGFGVAKSPSQNEAAVVDVYGQDRAVKLLADVRQILNQVNLLDVDWSTNDLVSAGKLVRAEVHYLHPNLEAQALDAIEWKFTFDWR